MRTIEEHLAAALALAQPLATHEVSLDEALGLVLAQDITSSTALPRFDNSAMDGYAVRAADVAAASAATPVTFGPDRGAVSPHPPDRRARGTLPVRRANLRASARRRPGIPPAGPADRPLSPPGRREVPRPARSPRQ